MSKSASEHVKPVNEHLRVLIAQAFRNYGVARNEAAADDLLAALTAAGFTLPQPSATHAVVPRAMMDQIVDYVIRYARSKADCVIPAAGPAISIHDAVWLAVLPGLSAKAATGDA